MQPKDTSKQLNLNYSKLVKRAFYPCCANDISEPRTILSGLVDEIIFCDLKKPSSWEKEVTRQHPIRIDLLQTDVETALATLPPISVFFYRKDSPGEGGSGLFLLSRKWLQKIVRRFVGDTCLILTDKSNHSGRFFRKVERPMGYSRITWGWHFSMSDNQPYLDSFGLTLYEVKRIQS